MVRLRRLSRLLPSSVLCGRGLRGGTEDQYQHDQDERQLGVPTGHDRCVGGGSATAREHRRPQTYSATDRITRAGEPTATVPAGTSFVTSEPAPTTAWSPMVKPGRRVTFEPIHTLRPMTTRAVTESSTAAPVSCARRARTPGRFVIPAVELAGDLQRLLAGLVHHDVQRRVAGDRLAVVQGTKAIIECHDLSMAPILCCAQSRARTAGWSHAAHPGTPASRSGTSDP